MCLRRIVANPSWRHRLALKANLLLGSLLLVLHVSRLATVDSAVVHPIRYERVLRDLNFNHVRSQARFNTCVTLARWYSDSCAHILSWW